MNTDTGNGPILASAYRHELKCCRPVGDGGNLLSLLWFASDLSLHKKRKYMINHDNQ